MATPKLAMVENAWLTPKSPAKRPQSDGPRFRARAIATRDVATTAENCEKRSSALSRAQCFAHPGNHSVCRILLLMPFTRARSENDHGDLVPTRAFHASSPLRLCVETKT